MNDSPLPGVKVVVTSLLPPDGAAVVGGPIAPVVLGLAGLKITPAPGLETPAQRKRRFVGIRMGRVEITGPFVDVK